MPMLTNIVITVPSIIQGDGVQLQPVALHAVRISDFISATQIPRQEDQADMPESGNETGTRCL